MNARTLPRRGLVAIVASLGAGCLIGRVWMVGYRFDASALREASGTESAFAVEHVGDGADLIATDDRVESVFRIGPSPIEVSIRNLGADPLVLDTAEVLFIDSERAVHHVIDTSRDLSRQPVVEVPPRATNRLSLWPEDWAREGSNGRPSVWIGDSPLGGSTIEEESREKALSNRQKDVGKGFEVVLPMRIGHERVSYRFRFTVVGLVARRTLWA